MRLQIRFNYPVYDAMERQDLMAKKAITFRIEEKIIERSKQISQQEGFDSFTEYVEKLLENYSVKFTLVKISDPPSPDAQENVVRGIT